MMQSYWEINVSLKGKHFFATAPRSITTLAEFVRIRPEIVARFPQSEGFMVTATYWKAEGATV